jgi:hypothetical protein
VWAADYAAQWKAPHVGQAIENRFDDGYRLSAVNVSGESIFRSC